MLIQGEYSGRWGGWRGKGQNSQTYKMIDLIKAATLTNNPELQKQAQAKLLQYRNQHLEDFFIQGAGLLANREVEIPTRQAAGTLLTVSLKNKSNDVYLWHRLTPASRTNIKDLVLTTMIDREKLIRRAAANIVAAICCIEVPKGEWPGIVEKITQNIASEDLTVKEVSILTVGFICEQLKEFEFYFQQPLQDTILMGILLGVKDPHPEIAETAFKALRDGIPAMSLSLKEQQVRQFLISQIVEAINKKNFVDYCLQALAQFVKSNYSLLNQQYIEIMAKYTLPSLTDTKDENCCILAMQFWNTVAREENNIESNPNLNHLMIGSIGQQIVQALLQNLCFVEEQDEDSNGIAEAAASALQAVFDNDSTQFEPRILDFTSKTISHENWKYRQASIRAFALLLIGLPSSRSQELVNNSLLSLVQLLNDSVLYVQLSAIKSLSMITQEVPQVMLRHEKCLQILDFVLKMGHNQVFLKHVAKIVDNLTMPEQSSQVLGQHAGSMIEVFMGFCLQSGRSNPSISSCLNVIINLIKCSRSMEVSNQYIKYVLDTYPKLHGLQTEKKELFVSGFFTMAQVCLMTIRKVNGTITMDLLSTLYNLVVQHFKRINDVQGDGFYIVSALAYFLPNDKRLIDDFWKYIEHGLSKLSQEDIFRSAISCICDFATTYREAISDKVDPIVNQILDLYQNNLITRDLKLDVLMCIGELFLQCGDFCSKHLTRVMDLLHLSCEGVLSIPDLNYAEILQESIIETLMCIFHGISDGSIERNLNHYVMMTSRFVELTTDKTRRPKLDYVKESMMLLGDIANIYQQSKSYLMNQPFVQDRVNLLIGFNKDGHLTQTITYLKQQFLLK